MSPVRSFLVVVTVYSGDGSTAGVTSQVVRDAPFGTAAAFADHLRCQVDELIDVRVLDYISSNQPED